MVLFLLLVVCNCTRKKKQSYTLLLRNRHHLVLVGLAVLLLASEAQQLTVTTASDDGDGSFRNAFKYIASGDSTAAATILLEFHQLCQKYQGINGSAVSSLYSNTPLHLLFKAKLYPYLKHLC